MYAGNLLNKVSDLACGKRLTEAAWVYSNAVSTRM